MDYSAGTLQTQPVQRPTIVGCNIAKTVCPKAWTIWLQHCQDGLSKSMDYMAATLPTQPVQKHRVYDCNIANTARPGIDYMAAT